MTERELEAMDNNEDGRCVPSKARSFKLADTKQLENITRDDGRDRTKNKCSLGSRTAAAFLGYFGMGAALSILGPTLISMAILHDTDIAGISWSFTSMRIGGLIGALLCGVFLDIINRELLLAFASYIAGIAQIVAPFTGVLLGFVALMGVQGVGVGFLDAGCPPYLMFLWDGSPTRDTVMHSMSVFASLGQFLSPLSIRNLLVVGNDVTSANATGCRSQNVTSSESSSVLTSDVTNLIPNDVTVDAAYNVTTDLPSGDVADVSLSRYAYVMVGCIPLLAALLSSFNFIVLKGFKNMCGSRKETTVTNTNDSPSTSKSNNMNSVDKNSIVILVLLCPHMWVYNWLESNPGAFLSSFVVKGLCMDIKTGSDITSVYWGCHMLGRFLTIFASKWIRPKPILCVLFVFDIFAAGIGLFIPLEPRLVWGTAVLGGLGVSSFYFTTFLWISDYVQVTGKVSAMCVIFIYGGGAVGPLVVGNLFQSYGYMWVIYIHVAAVITQILLFFAIEIYARSNKLGIHGKIVAELEVTADENEELNPNLHECNSEMS